MTDAAAAANAARAVADAVLYEGYLLYPYRASSAKNAVRWQFGVLGPPGGAPGVAEPPALHTECLLRSPGGAAVSVLLRFLQLQRRTVERVADEGIETGHGFRSVADLRVGDQRWLPWDEAVTREVRLGPFALDVPATEQVTVAGGRDVELVHDHGGLLAGRLVRRRRELHAVVAVTAEDLGGGLHRLCVTVTNAGGAEGGADELPVHDRDGAAAASLLGAHLLLGTDRGRFVSLLEPPPDAAAAAASCVNTRCWPVLASPADDLVLVSPIILYDHPEVAPESAGELYDATEIDEILTLRVMTMTEQEKSEARATDPRAAAVIDRCDAMSPEQLQGLHGRLRDPHLESPPEQSRWSGTFDIPTWSEESDKPWWDPGVDAAVDPDTDHVRIGGVAVSRGSRVLVRPGRRADAQDMFFTGRQATVAAVYADVDGNAHVAVVLTDDPAADVREWYGRYLYFAPDELEPLPDESRGPGERVHQGKEG